MLHRHLELHGRMGAVFSVIFALGVIGCAPVSVSAAHSSPQGATDRPVGGILNGGDALYGSATRTSRAHRDGYIYRLAYNGTTFAEIHRFIANWVSAPLSLGNDGKIYGSTMRGGAYDAGTVFSIDRDGKNLRILYSYRRPVNSPGVAATDFGVVAFVPGNDPGASAVAVIKDGLARTVHDFGAGSYTRELCNFGDSGYGVVDSSMGCGSEVFRVDVHGYHFITGGRFARGSASCAHAHYFIASALADGILYTEDGVTVSQIRGTAVSPLYGNIAVSHRPGPGFLPGLSPLSGGGVAAFSVGDDQSSCGSIISVEPDGSARALHIFPAAACAWRDLTPNTLVVASNGTVYGIEPPHLDCGIVNPNLPDSAKSCGRVFAIERGAFRTLHEFLSDAPAEAKVARNATVVLTATGIPREFLLTQVVYQQTPAMTLPSALPLSFVALRTHDSVPLVIGSPTTAPAPMRPEVRGPALPYHSTQALAGVYDLFSGAQEMRQRFYFPVEELSPTFAVGQTFLALSGLVGSATLDPQGRTFGTQLLTVTKINANESILRAADLRLITLPFVPQDPKDIPGMIAVLADPVARRLDSIYKNKDVYVRPQFYGTCVREGGVPFILGLAGKLRVSAIYRVRKTSALSIDESNSDSSTFQSVDPLVVTFAVPLHAQMKFASGTSSLIDVNPSTCLAYYALAADEFQLERMVSLTPLINDPWPPRLRKAIEEGRVLPGMTYRMVATIGYPPIFESIEEMQKRDRWDYIEPAPFSHTVFFSHGIVVRYDPPGSLP